MNNKSSESKGELEAGNLTFKIFRFACLDSTNGFLKSNLPEYPDYSVVVAENQTAGRGRFDRSWVSKSSKSLTFSIKLPLDSIPRENWCNITQLMAVAVAQVLEELKLQPKIRWPNDVLVNDAKICGILAELVSCGSDFNIVIGTGLNINETFSDFSGIDRMATSVFCQTEQQFSGDAILEKLIYNFGVLFEKMADSGFGSIIGSIAERLYKPGTPVRVLSGDTEYIGTVRGLSTQGRILLDTVSGTVEVLSGEITSRV